VKLETRLIAVSAFCAVLCSALSPGEVCARTPRRWLRAQRYAAEPTYIAYSNSTANPVKTTTTAPLNAPSTVSVKVTIGTCTGTSNKCGITAAVKITRGAADPLVTGVYMVVGSCPACTTCATPTTSMEPADVVIGDAASAMQTTLEYRFSSVDDPNSNRLVACDQAHSICIIVCLSDGTCKRKAISGITPNTICNGLCPECEYLMGGVAMP
jgi:hypothetical protein